MLKSFRSVFVVLFVAVAGWSQADLTKPIPLDPNVRFGKLPNGLSYYIRHNAKPERKAELRLAVDAGSILERDDQQGLAHFMEHMNFNGTTHFPKNELVSYLQSIGVRFGADINAYTSFDETVYMLSIPTEKKDLLGKGITVLADWAAGANLDMDEINKERGVVLEELRLGQGAGQRMRDKYYPRLFEGAQYANRIPIGKKDILEHFDRKALMDFYETWYRPDLMAVVVVGDVDVAETEAAIKANFSGLKAKRGEVKRPSFPVPDTKGTLVDIETDKEAPFTSAQLMYKRPAERVSNQADLRRSMVREFYNAMLGARLDELRQSPNPPFIGAGAGFTSIFREKAAYSMFSQMSPDKIATAISAMLTENRRVQQFGFTAPEFERAKQRYLTRLENEYREKDTTESYQFADEYVYNFLEHEPVPGIEFRNQFSKSVLPTITLEEINALAKNTTTADNRAIIITGAEKEGLKYPTKEEILAVVNQAESAPIKPYTETVSNEPLVKELPRSATIASESADPKLGTTTWMLSNGIKIVLKPTDYKQDEILMRGFSPGGSSLVPDNKARAADSFSSFVGSAGAGGMSQVQLNKMLSGKRARASISLSNELQSLNGNSSPKDLETMLQLAYLRFTNTNFDKAEFDSFISKQKMLLPNLIADPGIYFGEETSRLMSQNHPRVFGLPTAEQLDQLKIEDMQAIYKDRFADASGFTFIFVGNFKPDEIKPLLVKYLGALPAGNRKETWKDLGIRPPKGEVNKTFYKGVDQKSQVQIVFTGPAKFDLEDRYYLGVVSDLLNIKLTEILREEKGGVYTVSSAGTMSRIPWERFTFTVAFPCGPDNVTTLTAAAMGEIAKLQNGQIEDKDIQKVKETRSVKLKEDFKTNDFWFLELSRVNLQNIPFYTEGEAQAKIDAVNKADIQRIAKKYLTPEYKIQAVLMPADRAPK